MTTSVTHMWTAIEKVVGVRIDVTARKRWNKRYPGRLQDLAVYIDRYIEEHPDEHGKHDTIWTLMRMLDNGDWPLNQALPDRWDDDEREPPRSMAAVPIPEPIGYAGDDVLSKMPDLIQGLVEDRLEGSSVCVDFAIAGAITQVAAVCGNRLRYRAWRDIRMANVYIVLVGKTAQSYKSSVGRRIQETLLAVDPKLLAAEGVSPEGLLMDLTDSPSRLWMRDEFAGLISAMRQRDHMRGAHDMLLELFDRAQAVYQKRLAKAQFTTREPPALSFFGTIQPEVMGEELFSGRNVDSGFVNRFLLVCGEGMSREWPEQIDYQARREALRARLKQMTRETSCTIEGEHLVRAASLWDGNERAAFGKYGEFVALRAKVHAMKLAALFQAADGWPYGKNIEARWLDVALALLERWFKKSADLIGLVHILQDGERDRRDFFTMACHATHNSTGPHAMGQLAAEAQISKRKAEEYLADLSSMGRGWLGEDDQQRIVCTKASPLCEKAAAK